MLPRRAAMPLRRCFIVAARLPSPADAVIDIRARHRHCYYFYAF